MNFVPIPGAKLDAESMDVLASTKEALSSFGKHCSFLRVFSSVKKYFCNSFEHKFGKQIVRLKCLG